MGFITSNPSTDEDRLLAIRSKLVPDLSVMYLVLTDKCNLRCRYCFIEAGFSNDYVCCDMDWTTAKKGIDYFLKNRSSTGEIWFYGGEPLINSDLLFKCLEYLEENDSAISSVIVTNGTLITDEIAKKFLQHSKLQVSVSLDGIKEIHDQQRIFSNGEGSFEQTSQGIECLRNNGVPFGISLTIAKHNVDVIPETVSWICDNYDVKTVGINFLVDTCKSLVSEEYMRRANCGLIDSFIRQRNGEVYESRIHRKVEAFLEKRPRRNDCAACGNQIVISPQGMIGVCHEGIGEKKTFASSLADQTFDFYSDQTVADWSRRSPFNSEVCLKCAALGICGGGCPYGAMLKTGSITEIDKRFCIHSKETLEWLIWDLFDKVESRLNGG